MPWHVTSPVTDLPLANAQAGAQSDAVELHLWNSQGEPAGQPVANAMALFQAEDPTRVNTFLSTGLPPLDELWGRARIIGFQNEGDPSWSISTTDWQPWGADRPLVIGDAPADCAVHVEVALAVPSTAVAVAYRFSIAVLVNEFSRPAPAHVAAFHRGVLTHNGDQQTTFMIEGGAIIASSTPDDQVHVSRSLALTLGIPAGLIGTSHTLDQIDGQAEPMAAGESYVALLSRAANGVTVTKGDRGAYARAAAELDVPEAHIRAVAAIEGRHRGFRSDGSPVILYERHWFRRLTGGRWSDRFPELSGPRRNPGTYGTASMQHQYLDAAQRLDWRAAHQSCSYGLFQVKGFDWQRVGFASLGSFVGAMWTSADAQAVSKKMDTMSFRCTLEASGGPGRHKSRPTCHTLSTPPCMNKARCR